jgi:hypothetical protein
MAQERSTAIGDWRRPRSFLLPKTGLWNAVSQTLDRSSLWRQMTNRDRVRKDDWVHTIAENSIMVSLTWRVMWRPRKRNNYNRSRIWLNVKMSQPLEMDILLLCGPMELVQTTYPGMSPLPGFFHVSDVKLHIADDQQQYQSPFLMHWNWRWDFRLKVSVWKLLYDPNLTERSKGMLYCWHITHLRLAIMMYVGQSTTG